MKKILLILAAIFCLAYISEEAQAFPEDAIVKVNIYKTAYGDTLFEGHGSGVILNDSTILTNEHVASKNRIIKVLIAGKEIKADIVHISDKYDISILHIKPIKGLTHMKLAPETYKYKIQSEVFAIGFPYSLPKLVTRGYIINENLVDGYILHQAPINGGNSGGACINSNGKLIGLNTVIFTRDGGFQGYSGITPIKHIHEELTKHYKKKNKFYYRCPNKRW